MLRFFNGAIITVKARQNAAAEAKPAFQGRGFQSPVSFTDKREKRLTPSVYAAFGLLTLSALRGIIKKIFRLKVRMEK